MGAAESASVDSTEAAGEIDEGDESLRGIDMASPAATRGVEILREVLAISTRSSTARAYPLPQ